MQTFSQKSFMAIQKRGRKLDLLNKIAYTYDQKGIDIYQNILLLIGAKIYKLNFVAKLGSLPETRRLSSGSVMA
jgi:hypothetical protein